MNIKPHKKHKAIESSIELNQLIKEMENNDGQWFLKLFGVYRFQSWYQGKIQALREAQSNCNGFCGEYECKENQAHCKRLKKASEK
jgi:hypothetical protein